MFDLTRKTLGVPAWGWFTLAGVFYLYSKSASVSGMQGIASWYGPGYHGKLTASGQIFDQNALTAAHKTLKFGTVVRVTDKDTGKNVVVKINDRGPFVAGRIIDLSKGAATMLGIIEKGLANVRIEVV